MENEKKGLTNPLCSPKTLESPSLLLQLPDGLQWGNSTSQKERGSQSLHPIPRQGWILSPKKKKFTSPSKAESVRRWKITVSPGIPSEPLWDPWPLNQFTFPWFLRKLKIFPSVYWPFVFYLWIDNSCPWPIFPWSFDLFRGVLYMLSILILCLLYMLQHFLPGWVVYLGFFGVRVFFFFLWFLNFFFII